MDKAFLGKKIIIGVSGSIAAYKSADLVSSLKKAGADVHVIMTKNAKRFIGAETLAALSGNKVNCSFFEDESAGYPHLDIVKSADLFVIAPATANIMAKICGGFAAEVLEATALTAKCPKIICPAMNGSMYLSAQVQDNIKKLESISYKIVEPEKGRLACGEEGVGRLASIEKILTVMTEFLNCGDKFFQEKKVLIINGATREYIDDVRFISNNSSGEMGSEIADLMQKKGADLTMISGVCTHSINKYSKNIHVESSEEMLEAVKKEYNYQDIVISTAAISDITFQRKEGKIKKNNNLPTDFLENAKFSHDILKWCGANKKKHFLVGFSLEPDFIEYNAMQKIIDKNLDLLFANKIEDLGTHKISSHIIDKKGQSLFIGEKIRKREAAGELLKIIKEKLTSITLPVIML